MVKHPLPLTRKPLNQRTFDSIALNRQFWGPNLSKIYYWKVWEAQKFKWSYLLNKVKLWNAVKSVYTPAMTTFDWAWHDKMNHEPPINLNHWCLKILSIILRWKWPLTPPIANVNKPTKAPWFSFQRFYKIPIAILVIICLQMYSWLMYSQLVIVFSLLDLRFDYRYVIFAW